MIITERVTPYWTIEREGEIVKPLYLFQKESMAQEWVRDYSGEGIINIVPVEEVRMIRLKKIPTISIEDVSEIVRGDVVESNRVDLILRVFVPDESYLKYGIDKEDYPKDAWTLFVTQNDNDRMENQITMSLANEGFDCSRKIQLSDVEKEMVFNFIKENQFDVLTKIMVNENTKIQD